MRKLLLLALLYSGLAYGQDTTISYKNQPPPAAMAPSVSSFSQDVCSLPVSGAVSTAIIGIAGGSVIRDDNCERIKLARALNDLGLKVSAVAVLCDDPRIWDAMEISGTPCPIGGSVGDAARMAWWKLYPERFRKLYGQDFVLSVRLTSSGSK